MARTTAPRNARRQYVTTFEHEGRKWGESVAAESLKAAELHAENQAYTRGLRIVSTLPLNPDA
ncbi:hypothetical protein [Luteibacter sp. 22Crub2.1]|uniref:hypothetical protein n=1 Tax=Luteibacter sp. 22Crub2.1 TaxID=1283288 RepID=UPI0009A5798B|nr:hypothetical protein [Luteibacter sp. 22Crub2.1]SKB51096.1 hypothetical protein SAMN05660880_01392 [Luteibacter sp. 22Crub2.1]